MPPSPDALLPACDLVSRAGQPELDHMFLRGIEAHKRHGVHDFERHEGQRFVVDVDWWIDTAQAIAEDRLDATLCYKQLYDIVVEVIGGEPWRLIETLADKLCRRLLAGFDAMQLVRITVHKPDAPIGGTFADVGIHMTRHRGNQVTDRATAPERKPANPPRIAPALCGT